MGVTELFFIQYVPFLSWCLIFCPYMLFTCTLFVATVKALLLWDAYIFLFFTCAVLIVQCFKFLLDSFFLKKFQNNFYHPKNYHWDFKKNMEKYIKYDLFCLIYLIFFRVDLIEIFFCLMGFSPLPSILICVTIRNAR